jgi:UDP-N-acetyl-D-galactosamine dehydrogenase
VVHALNDYGIKVTIFDPLANTEEVMHEYGLECHTELGIVNPRSLSGVEGLGGEDLDAIVLGVAHKEFLKMDLNPFKKETGVVYDVKGVLENADIKL